MVRGGVIVSVLANFQDCYCLMCFAHQEFAGVWFTRVIIIFIIYIFSLQMMDFFQISIIKSVSQYTDTQ